MTARTISTTLTTMAALLNLAGTAFAQQPAPASPAAPALSPSAPATPPAAPDPNLKRETKDYNLPKTKVALEGHDPVAYFPEGGGKAVKGSDKFAFTFRGVVYHFASQANLDRFKADPDKYEPAYGGWCAWAMREGDKVEIDPKAFIVKDGRLFLFYNGWLGDTRAKWQKGDHAAEAKSADGEWKKISGESPRQPKAEDKKPADPPAPGKDADKK